MFYASKFLRALAELEGAIVHQDKSAEDAMFDAVKQSKADGLKPAEAALSYFVTEAGRGIAANPDSWRPMAHQASQQVKEWLEQKKICQQYADMYFDFLRDTEPDEA